MSNKRITEMYIKQIIELKKRGKSQRQISELLGLHRKTVREYLSAYETAGSPETGGQEEDLMNLLGLEPKEKEESERGNVLESFLKREEKNKSKPGFTIQNLYESYKSTIDLKYHYSRPQFYRQVKENWEKPGGSLKLNHEYGAKLFIDFAGDKLRYYDKNTGEERKMEVLVGILPASNYIYIEALENQGVKNLIQGIKSTIEDIGGVPGGIVTDNLKSAVTKSGRYDSVINKDLQSFAIHYETTIDPTRPYRPKDKALVEGAVKIIYSKVYYHVQDKAYSSLAELNTEIRKKLKELNTGNLTHHQVSRQNLLEEERAYLQPLPTYEWNMKTHKKAKVQKMGYIWFGERKNYYSVPYEYIGKTVELQYDASNLQVYYRNILIALHKVSHKPGEYITNPHHLSSANKAVSEWCPEYFISKVTKYKQESITAYVEELIKQRAYPEQAYKQVLGIINLCKVVGEQRVSVACTMASKHSQYSYRMIKEILDNNRDKIWEEEQEQIPQPIIPPHTNIRGSKAFS